MNLTETPDSVTWPDTVYCFVEKIGPFQETAMAAWQELMKAVPVLPDQSKLTHRYFARYPGVRQFMDQRHLLLLAGGSRIDDVEALFLIVVKGGGLLAQQVFGLAAEIEILRDQAKHFERQLFGAGFFVVRAVFDMR